jgi:Protein of unknown function (DUF4230)
MLKQRVAILALLLTIIFALGLMLGVFLPRWAGFSPASKGYNSAALLQQVKTVSELVTVQYVIEKVVVLEDVKWIAGLGENRVLMIAHGIVKAGLDLSELQPGDLQVSGTKVVIKLPPTRIIEAYLDERQTRVVERSTGLLRMFDKDLEQTARQNAVDDIRRAARSGGILKDADKRARVQLENLFRQLGFEEVEFRSR